MILAHLEIPPSTIQVIVFDVKIVRSLLLVFVGMSLAWVLATQDMTQIDLIDPTVDLPALHHTRSLHRNDDAGVVASLSVASKMVLPGAGDGGASSGLVAAVVAFVLAAPTLRPAILWQLSDYRPPLLWLLNSPSTAPPLSVFD
jgi:hypothetical protein